MSSDFDTGADCARRLDARDSLSAFRGHFHIPPDTIYLDGNSLGLLSRQAEASLKRVSEEWRELAIGGWLDAGTPWFTLAEHLGERAAALVGAGGEEVVCAGATTVNLHALLASFYAPEGRRTKILADALNFPSDIYALQGQLALRGLAPQENLVLVPPASPGDQGLLDEETIIRFMSEEVAVALLPSVLYRSGQLLDMAALTREAHERGILIGFDCSHSTGVVPHRFDDWGVDFAFWCGYKYLNGGPGSAAFLYVNRRHFGRRPLLAGWFGSDKDVQFQMSLDFQPAAGAGRWQISSPPILSMAPLKGALEVTREAGIERIREKSLRLTDYLIFLADRLLPEADTGISVATPRDHSRRGGHVALSGDERMWRVYQALKARGVVADFRPPGILRLAPVPLYNSFREVHDTLLLLKQILDSREYEAFPDEKSAVT
jgi:kynureninase